MFPIKSIAICLLAISIFIPESLNAKNMVNYNYKINFNYDCFGTSYSTNYTTIKTRTDKVDNNRLKGIGGIVSFGKLITENMAIEGFFDFVQGKISTKSEKYIVTEKKNEAFMPSKRGVLYKLGNPAIYNIPYNRITDNNDKVYEEYTLGIGSNIMLNYIILNSFSTNIALGSGVIFKTIEYLLSGNAENNNNKTMTFYKSYVLSNITKVPFIIGVVNINHEFNHFTNIGLEYQVKYQLDREIKTKENNFYRINFIDEFKTNNKHDDDRNLVNKGTTFGKVNNIYCSMMIVIKITL